MQCLPGVEAQVHTHHIEIDLEVDHRELGDYIFILKILLLLSLQVVVVVSNNML